MSADIVISGLGTVSSCGCGKEALGAALEQARTHFVDVDRSACYHRKHGARTAALSQHLDLTCWLPRARARRMGPPSRFAVAAARLALLDAKLTDEESAASSTLEGYRTAVVLGNSHGPTEYTERILRQVFLEGPTSVSPMLFTESVANAPAARIALELKALGPNITITQREAGPLLTVDEGATLLEGEYCDLALVGTAEECAPLLHAVLDRYRALARSNNRGPELARPFDAKRNGFIAGEGATIVVLEREEAALERGARPLARVRLSTSAFDPDAPSTGWSRDPSALARRLADALDRAGMATEEIDLIVSGANGAKNGDSLEAGILHQLFQNQTLPPIIAPKAVTGEYVGSTLATAVLACEGQSFGKTPGFEEIDSELGVRPHDGTPLPAPRRVLVTALGTGGAAAWLVLERFGD